MPLGLGAGLPLELFSMFASVARIVSGGPLHSAVNYIKDVKQNEQVFLEKNYSGEFNLHFSGIIKI